MEEFLILKVAILSVLAYLLYYLAYWFTFVNSIQIELVKSYASYSNPGRVVRQYKPAAILGWRGLRVTVIKLTFRHPGRPGARFIKTYI